MCVFTAISAGPLSAKTSINSKQKQQNVAGNKFVSFELFFIRNYIKNDDQQENRQKNCGIDDLLFHAYFLC